eukprot:gb/GECH01011697.1/.p1 GENE.gb/GECH01011697.1/~~gb/GECH01011697.1/.p1  ORF type:complete len:141 (+),score=24.25 gb/GECH01011697.1/:1-423(+)
MNKTKTILALCLLVTLLSSTFAAYCGGNCPGRKCPSCPCGTSKKEENIRHWCSKFSGWNQACCRCIVKEESGGNAHALNYNTNGSFDIGLWQINSINWNSCNGGNPPCDPKSNLECAIDVWKWGHGSFRLWSTCKKCGCC